MVHNIAQSIYDQYGPRFELYYVGSYARDEEHINDYDIAIYDNSNNSNEWSNVLSLFDGVTQDGKPIDAQIDMSIKEKISMSGDELYVNRDRPIQRYIYRNGTLIKKDTVLVTEKQRNKGLDNMKHAHIRII